jgi:hypothetical protein
MKIDGPPASPPIKPLTAKGPPPSDPEVEVTGEAEDGEKDNGVLSKLESDFFVGQGVADIRLRLAHAVENTGEKTFDVPDHGPTKAYQKFLDQYEDLYPPPPDPVAQVDTLTVGGTIEVGDIFTITNNTDPSDPVSITATAGEATDNADAINKIVDELVGLWSSEPAFTGIITAAADGPNITLTAVTAGEPFSVFVTTTEGDGSTAVGQIFESVTTTEASSAAITGSGGELSGGLDVVG